MLKWVFLFVSCAYVAHCASVIEPIPIISEESVIEHDGKFHFSYESGDGTKVEEHGENKVIDKDHGVESVGGSYSYSAPDGQQVLVQYVADENGFQPTGDVIPVAPPIPEPILKSLKYNEEHPEEDDA